MILKWTCTDCGATGLVPDDILGWWPHDCRSKGPFDEVSELFIEEA